MKYLLAGDFDNVQGRSSDINFPMFSSAFESTGTAFGGFRLGRDYLPRLEVGAASLVEDSTWETAGSRKARGLYDVNRRV